MWDRSNRRACECMSMPFEYRLEILLDDERHARITSVARERGVSVATVVREAIDRAIDDAHGCRASAARRISEAPDMPVPDPVGLNQELDSLRGRHA